MDLKLSGRALHIPAEFDSGLHDDNRLSDVESLLRSLWKDRRPYVWQFRFLDQLLAGNMPSSVDIPTGLGKTSVIALWLVARASGAAVPRRLVYIVDRRAVVDQATEEALHLCGTLDIALRSPDANPEWRRRLGLDHGDSLPLSTLRGQHRDNRAALERPGTAAIIIGTVDMIGSRLLFQGYGVSRKMGAPHAALIGSDALVVLDEAHLARPFQALLGDVARMRADAGARTKFHVMALSATPGADPQEQEGMFRLRDPDFADPPVARRLRAEKRIKLFEVDKKALAGRLAEHAWGLASRDAGGNRVVVYCDSRATASDVHEELRGRTTKQKWPDPELLVGARRRFERERVADSEVFQRFRPGLAPSAAPAFLVATSAGEVGVDLDADHMVCDLVPWERMVQRFGRVNRRPDPGIALVDVLVVVSEKIDEAESPPADAAAFAARRAPFELSSWPQGEDGRRDASPQVLAGLRADPDSEKVLRAASTPDPLRPPLTAPVLEAWSMTWLPDHYGRPLVAPWLRGWVEDDGQTNLVWRAHLPVKLPKSELQRFVEAASPDATETLEVPARLALAALRKRLKAAERSKPDMRYAILLERDGKFRAVVDLTDPRHLTERELLGRTLLLPVRLGGLKDGLLDAASHDPVSCIDGEFLAALDGEGEELLGKVRGESGDWARGVGRRVRSVRRDETEEDDWIIVERFALDEDADDDGAELRVERLRNYAAPEDATAFTRKWRHGVAPGGETLVEHTRKVVHAAQDLADRLDLPPDMRDTLLAAAELHDRGKARREWQTAMGAPRQGGPWAKSAGTGSSAVQLAGYRHEFGSLGDMEGAPELAELAPEQRDLAMHLVAAHHGRARPTIPPIDPDAPITLLESRAGEAALRFTRLQGRHGAWELAWLEWLLRAADWRGSDPAWSPSEQG